MIDFILGLMILCLIIWLFLILFWGQFWRVDQQLPIKSSALARLPKVCVIVPARNEADVIPVSLRSLLLQDYPGEFKVLLVDDQSADGTANVAEGVAYAVNKTSRLKIITSEDLPPGWTGKLWAMQQGVQLANQLQLNYQPDYILFTDADIEHHISNLRRLITKAETDNLDLVSLMVKLRCQSFWEKLLIPAFVFFFQKLYPFRWVNNPKKSTAAAAGGCILISRKMLTKIGGLTTIRTALIDDCSLAKAVKSHQGKIWLGLTSLTYSLRPYDSLETIWNMVARSAYTQLNYSPFLLFGSVLGMIVVYILPILGIFLGLLLGNWLISVVGLCTWLLMSFAYFPIVAFYKVPLWFAFCLPIIALFYTVMTIDSAKRHWQGVGGAWKGRVY
ncbi:MAG: glycosyltransferase [Nostocales cyanobacterium]|nr:MAG: glycosyltransferase [Nostocales cyanobacterium]TAF16688.1 MAG: glycosyltransferase [Nostocales cyanobacterium]